MSACPKCKFELEEEALECPACGIVIAKYLALGTGEVPVVHDGGDVPGLAPEEDPTPGFAPPPPSPSTPAEGTVAPPPPASPENPYAPPMAEVAPQEAAPGEILASADVITQLTVESLVNARPWMRFLVIYGWLMIGFIILGGLGVLISAPGGSTEGLVLFLVYLFYTLVGLALLLPMARSTSALKGLGTYQTSEALEGFAVNQAKFWRRSGIIAAIGLVLMGLLLLLLFVGVGASLLS